MCGAEIFEAYGLYIAIAAFALLIVIWFIMRANRKAMVVRESMTKDVLDEGAERAHRNQSLIDAGTPAPQVTVAAEPTPVAATIGDDLTRIKGLGPKIATMLNQQGITTYADIAAWSEADIDRIDAQLGRFEGRIRRDSWVEQAKLLSDGDESGFSNKFGQNG